MNSSKQRKPVSLPFEIRLTLLYLTIGILWILFSDYIILNLVDGDLNQLAKMQTLKGWGFVFVTAMLLFILLRANFKKNQKYIKEIIQARAEAERANKLKTTFLANLSHELRTPMNAINGFSELIKQYVASPDVSSQYHKIIHENSLKLLKIIENIVDMSKIQTNLLELKPIAFSIDEFCSALKENTENIIPSNKIIHFVKPLQETLLIHTDLTRLLYICEVLVLNSLSNPGKGSLKLSCIIVEEKVAIDIHWELSVVETQSQIVSEGSEIYLNDSLGWDVAKGMAKLLQGKISAHQLNDKSYRFLLSLPIKLRTNE